MPCKAKSKPAGNIPNNPHASLQSPNVTQCGTSSSLTTFKLSATTQWFLALMNQNLQVLSQFTWADLTAICSNAVECAQVYEDLLAMHFTLWCKKNMHIIESDEECDTLINNLRLLAGVFGLIPAPHKCPPPPPLCAQPHLDNAPPHQCPLLPPPCVHLHQDDAPPCSCLHAEDAPPPSPCLLPHRSDNNTPMGPTTPTHAFSEVASQTPAPILIVDMPLPPLTIPAAVATSPAVAASIHKPGPKSRPSYAGAAGKNLNPAAPPFVCGPPCAPVAPPAQAPKASSNPQTKRPFYAT
ncbi:hypothetical protein P691DRAFT_767824 [Macrolepiota fuliginosa MF-IS2]|uniref:Uncharacterized protein n=1 Tax=Macrolepiota fuliginosa MF-IS2 TaxID=1400762 RepID=A0A9P5WZ49_9AGAR|nr:hypothetical protein P691DRAFT_767824 [Macrolepiota fuliginosa MF-IS2]